MHVFIQTFKIRKVFDANSFFYCRIRFSMGSKWNPMISTGKISLFPAGDTGTISFESPALCLHPQLRRGAQRRSRRSLCGRPCPRCPQLPPPQQAAALCLPAHPSRRHVTVRTVRNWQKGTTPVLSVIRYSGDDCQVWHLKVVALTCSRDP